MAIPQAKVKERLEVAIEGLSPKKLEQLVDFAEYTANGHEVSFFTT